MKVRYINKTDASLINGKIYEVQSVERGDYRIIDETGGRDFLFDPSEFEIVEEWIWKRIYSGYLWFPGLLFEGKMKLAILSTKYKIKRIKSGDAKDKYSDGYHVFYSKEIILADICKDSRTVVIGSSVSFVESLLY